MIAVAAIIIASSGLHILVGSPLYNPVEHLACVIRRGDLVVPGMPNAFVCLTPAVDEGKSCTDSSQCVESCIAETEESVTGTCTANHDVGCSWFLENGKAHKGCMPN